LAPERSSCLRTSRQLRPTCVFLYLLWPPLGHRFVSVAYDTVFSPSADTSMCGPLDPVSVCSLCFILGVCPPVRREGWQSPGAADNFFFTTSLPQVECSRGRRGALALLWIYVLLKPFLAWVLFPILILPLFFSHLFFLLTTRQMTLVRQ